VFETVEKGWIPTGSFCAVENIINQAVIRVPVRICYGTSRDLLKWPVQLRRVGYQKHTEYKTVAAAYAFRKPP